MDAGDENSLCGTRARRDKSFPATFRWRNVGEESVAIAARASDETRGLFEPAPEVHDLDGLAARALHQIVEGREGLLQRRGGQGDQGGGEESTFEKRHTDSNKAAEALYLLLMQKSVETYEAVCKFCPFCGYSVEKSHD